MSTEPHSASIRRTIQAASTTGKLITYYRATDMEDPRIPVWLAWFAGFPKGNQRVIRQFYDYEIDSVKWRDGVPTQLNRAMNVVDIHRFDALLIPDLSHLGEDGETQRLVTAQFKGRNTSVIEMSPADSDSVRARAWREAQSELLRLGRDQIPKFVAYSLNVDAARQPADPEYAMGFVNGLFGVASRLAFIISDGMQDAPQSLEESPRQLPRGSADN